MSEYMECIDFVILESTLPHRLGMVARYDRQQVGNICVGQCASELSLLPRYPSRLDIEELEQCRDEVCFGSTLQCE